MLNLSQLLLGVGCLDLIRIYQITKASGLGLSQLSIGSTEDTSVVYPSEASGSGGLSMPRTSGRSNMMEESASSDLVLIYVKKYYLFVAASVFFWNASIKFVTSQPGGKLRTIGEGDKRGFIS